MINEAAPPRVTIVVATYNRPEVLTQAILSVIRQTVQDWVMLIVGDSCDERTGAAIDAIGDPRIHYLNLQDRCGEQSGPNAVGLSAVFTDYVALLNHDDIWLPTHLETALAALEGGKADLYCGAIGVTTFATDRATGVRSPAFIATTPTGRTFDMAFHRNCTYFEPASTWVMRRSVVEVVGLWQPAAALHRTPLTDWLLRAWRQDVKAVFADAPTAIYCDAEKSNVANRKGEEAPVMYDWNDGEQAYWNDFIEKQGADAVLQLMKLQPQEMSRTSEIFQDQTFPEQVQWVFETYLNPANARLYKVYGWDAFVQACVLTKRPPGISLQAMLKRRTGEALKPRETWKQVIDRALEQLEQHPSWQQLRRQSGVA
ncbi:glycosyltransferase family 2 protein [Gimibacter soli]|uniref:Glycosyltransferase family 2 protein n=1 Tax=Gimibacter soli TaxID=3024400 RepID=A0AAE9XPQ4_9PROT|nr:glycosyltransferase family 2 protein [Gimibacter soli]WCL52660.1 glycosyltransferase family 2 protein [Gimibacter soli]